MSKKGLEGLKNEFVIDYRVILTKDLELNTGQIEGVPTNPRWIDEKGCQDLKNSILEDPEFLFANPLKVIPYGPFFVVLAGNQRLTQCVDLKILELPCLIINPNTPADKLKAFLMKDNISYGKHDWDKLANEWDTEQLIHWGVEMPFIGEVEEEQGESTKSDTYKITLDFGGDEPTYNLVKIKLTAMLEKDKISGVEVRG